MKRIFQIAACALPPFVTVALFWVLYANCLYGRSILIVLLLLNLAVVFLPVRIHHLAGAASMARLMAICVVSALGTVMALELIFPLVLPSEWAHMRDLADRTTQWLEKHPTRVTRIFTNERQKILNAHGAEAVRGKKSFGWHEPGKMFDYYGYECNGGYSYVNKIRWNRDGYFDNDYTFEKPPDAYRIVVIGDSYVEALQVPLEATFHKLLEAALNRHHGAGHDSSGTYQVIALGNSGSGQQKNLEVLKRLASRFHPNMVVMTLCSNDFCDDDPGLHDQRDLYVGEVTPLLRGLLQHHYYALAFAFRRYTEIRRNTVVIHPEFLQWSAQELPSVESAWARTLSLIEASRNYCSAHGVAFRLVYLGTELEVKYALDQDGTLKALRNMGAPYRAVTWDMNRSIDRVTRFCQQKGIHLISLLDPLVKSQKESGKRVFCDHYSLFGHEVAAAVLQGNLGLPNIRPDDRGTHNPSVK